MTATSAAPRGRVGRRAALLAGSGAILAAGTGVGALLVDVAPAGASTTFTVTSLDDTDTAGTLRHAIGEANATLGHDVIRFEDGLAGTITLTADLPAFTEIADVVGNGDVTIDGTWRDGGPAGFRALYFTYPTSYGTPTPIVVSDLTITGADDHGGAAYGAAVSMYSTGSMDITIDRVVLTANNGDFGSAIYIGAKTGGTVTVRNSKLTGNLSLDSGGAVTIYAARDTTAVFTDDVITDNVTLLGEGGLYLHLERGSTTISNCFVSDNTSAKEGGAIHLAAGDLSVRSSTFTGNVTSNGAGGALYLDGGTVEITDSTFADNSASDEAGAIRSKAASLHIARSTFSGNSADSEYGGAIALDGGVAVIESTTFSGNRASGSGGAIADLSDSLTVRNSTIDGNGAGADGGGIAVGHGTLTMQNSTIAHNRAEGAGGAISGAGWGTTIVASTITLNTASDIDGVAVGGSPLGPSFPAVSASTAPSDIAPPLGAVALTSTILAGNGTEDLGIGTSGVFVTADSDHSLIGTATVPITDLGATRTGLTGAALLLGPLADNGGPTRTFALLAGSPAIGSGPSALHPFPGSICDQRGEGFARSVDGRIDVGAYEVQSSIPRFTG